MQEAGVTSVAQINSSYIARVEGWRYIREERENR
jgi:hypothetical protein